MHPSNSWYVRDAHRHTQQTHFIHLVTDVAILPDSLSHLPYSWYKISCFYLLALYLPIKTSIKWQKEHKKKETYNCVKQHKAIKAINCWISANKYYRNWSDHCTQWAKNLKKKLISVLRDDGWPCDLISSAEQAVWCNFIQKIKKWTDFAIAFPSNSTLHI